MPQQVLGFFDLIAYKNFCSDYSALMINGSDILSEAIFQFNIDCISFQKKINTTETYYLKIWFANLQLHFSSNDRAQKCMLEIVKVLCQTDIVNRLPLEEISKIKLSGIQGCVAVSNPNEELTVEKFFGLSDQEITRRGNGNAFPNEKILRDKYERGIGQLIKYVNSVEDDEYIRYFNLINFVGTHVHDVVSSVLSIIVAWKELLDSLYESYNNFFDTIKHEFTKETSSIANKLETTYQALCKTYQAKIEGFIIPEKLSQVSGKSPQLEINTGSSDSLGKAGNKPVDSLRRLKRNYSAETMINLKVLDSQGQKLPALNHDAQAMTVDSCIDLNCTILVELMRELNLKCNSNVAKSGAIISLKYVHTLHNEVKYYADKMSELLLVVKGCLKMSDELTEKGDHYSALTKKEYKQKRSVTPGSESRRTFLNHPDTFEKPKDEDDREQSKEHKVRGRSSTGTGRGPMLLSRTSHNISKPEQTSTVTPQPVLTVTPAPDPTPVSSSSDDADSQITRSSLRASIKNAFVGFFGTNGNTQTSSRSSSRSSSRAVSPRDVDITPPGTPLPPQTPVNTPVGTPVKK